MRISRPRVDNRYGMVRFIGTDDIRIDLKQLVRCPVPVLGKAQLYMLCRGALYSQVCVAVDQVFFAQVVAAYKTGVSIDDQQLAVVAEIDLEAIAAPLGRFETRDFYTLTAHDLEVGIRHLDAAYFIVQEADPYAVARPVYQRIAHAPADRIVTNNIELDQHIRCRIINSADHVFIGFATIDQKFDVICTQKG